MNKYEMEENILSLSVCFGDKGVDRWPLQEQSYLIWCERHWVSDKCCSSSVNTSVSLNKTVVQKRETKSVDVNLSPPKHPVKKLESI